MGQESLGRPVYRFGKFELNAEDRTLLGDGRRISLTPRAFDLLHALVRADGHLVTKERLLDEVWADAIVEEGNLNRTISSLRKVLGESRGENLYIETVPKAGYRFAAPIVRISTNGRVAEEKAETVAERGDARRYPYAWMIAVASFVLILGGGIVVYLLVTGRGRPSSKQPAGPVMQRLTDNKFQEDQAEWTHDGQIRFVRFVTTNRAESWVMNADGSNQRRANDQIKSLLTGRWSPDGSRVVFTKETEGPTSVYLANVDGSGERKLSLTYLPADWSPDGGRLVTGGLVDRSNGEIFIYDIGSDQLTNLTNSPFFDSDPLFSPDGTKIAFTSDRDGNREAYLMNLDGSSVRRMTDDPSVDAFPTFSPDGTQLIFDSNRDWENVDLYIRNVNDDSPARKLTDLPSNEEHRGNCWSSDGTKLVITSDIGGTGNIYVIDAEADGQRLVAEETDADLQYPAVSPSGDRLLYQARYGGRLRLRSRIEATGVTTTLFTTDGDVGSMALAPAFSPDGQQIAFANKVDGNTEIAVINANGSSLRNVTRNPANDSAPAFSVDGREIFFQSNREGAFERFSIFRMNLDGSEQRRLTDKPGYEFSPRPVTERSLVFSGDRVDSSSRALDIRVVDLMDTNVEKIIASRRLHDSQPAVSPDGKRVAFVAQSDGNNEIYLVNVDGSGLVRLTRNAGDDITPTFSANGRSVIFSSDRRGRYSLYSFPV